MIKILVNQVRFTVQVEVVMVGVGIGGWSGMGIVLIRFGLRIVPSRVG